MEPNEQTIYEGTVRITEFVRSQVPQHGLEEAIAKASSLLSQRIVGALGSIYALRLSAGHSWSLDGMVILRSSYDATLQLVFMLHDPEKRSERAELYLDFLWIERHNLRHRIDSSNTEVAEYVASSSMRASGEEELDERLRAVGKQYLTKKGRQDLTEEDQRYLTSPKAKYRSHWYPGGLRDLARAVGYGSEYELFHKDASASVHASPMPLRFGPTIRARNMILWASALGLRASEAVADTYGVALSDDHREFFRSGRRNFYDASAVVGHQSQ